VQNYEIKIYIRNRYREGTFWEYLDIVVENPSAARNVFRRVYDMILTYGRETFTQFKKELTRYTCFCDPIDHRADAMRPLA
jgi:serine protein kinase